MYRPIKNLDSSHQTSRQKKMPASYLLVFIAILLASSLSLPDSFAQVKTASALPGAAPGAPGAPPQTQEIDIQAAEQDFAGDQVIVKGNVRVKSKDTVVTGPQATIYKDAGGQPQLAVFTGHPHLVQGKNKIDADTLTFQIAANKVIAEGHAHSEVVGNEEPANGASANGAAATGTPAVNSGPGAAASSSNAARGPAPKPKNGQPFEWPTADKDNAAGHAKAQPAVEAKAPAPEPKPAPKPVNKKDASGWQMDDENEPAAPSAGSAANAPPAAPAPPSTKPPDKIVTDSNHQEYESESGHFFAKGNVRVKHLDMKVTAEQLNLVYGNDGKPETAVFTGNVSATQNDNNTKADTVTYFLSTQRLQASGNVRSKVIQQKQRSTAGSQEAPKKGGLTSPNGNQASAAKDDGSQPGSGGTGGGKKKANSADRAKIASFDSESAEPIYILSDAQDYNKETGRMTAIGSVRVYYADNKGIGHKAVLLRNEDGKTQKIIFYGRSQIIQPGKRWIGDHIQFLVPNQKVVCAGNTKAIILNTNAQIAKTSTSTDESATPSDQGPDTNTNSQVDAKLANFKRGLDAKGADDPSDNLSGNSSDGKNQNAAGSLANFINGEDARNGALNSAPNGNSSQISTTKVDPTR